MRKVDLAYCAGIVDGEGCIAVVRGKPYRHLTGRINPSYHASLHVRMIDEAAIRFLRDQLGGWMWREKPHANNWRPLFCWQVHQVAAVAALERLLPFRRVKRAQAENVLAFRRLQLQGTKHRTKITGYRDFPNSHGTIRRVANKAYSDEYVAMLDAHYQRSRELNRVGAA